MLPETKHIRFSVDHRALIVRVPDASALEKTAQAAASNATSDFAEMTRHARANPLIRYYDAWPVTRATCIAR